MYDAFMQEYRIIFDRANIVRLSKKSTKQIGFNEPVQVKLLFMVINEEKFDSNPSKYDIQAMEMQVRRISKDYCLKKPVLLNYRVAIMQHTCIEEIKGKTFIVLTDYKIKQNF